MASDDDKSDTAEREKIKRIAATATLRHILESPFASEFVASLLKSEQEKTAEVEQLKRELEMMTKRLNTLRSELMGLAR